MKILIIRNYPNYMNVKYNTYNIQEVGLAKALIRKGHQCDIVFWTDKEEVDVKIEFDVNKVINIFYRKSKVILKNAIFNNIDKLFDQYDILQPCEYNQYQSLYLARKYPSKTVIYHGPYYSEFNTRYNLMCRFFDILFLKQYIRKDTKFIVKSNLAKKFLADKGVKSNNIKVAGVGIDVEMLTPSDNNKIPDFIAKVKNNEYDYKLLYIGKWEERRNIKFLFDILKRVVDLGHNVCLVMVGSGDKEYKSQCIKYAKEIGVYSRLICEDKLEQKYLSYLYKTTDIFLLPTHYEIFGMVLLEAMYYGLPVITTVNGGSDILISNNKNGMVLDSNPISWSEAVVELINDKKKREHMGKLAHDTIKGQYTWDQVSKTVIDAYKDRMD